VPGTVRRQPLMSVPAWPAPVVTRFHQAPLLPAHRSNAGRPGPALARAWCCTRGKCRSFAALTVRAQIYAREGVALETLHTGRLGGKSLLRYWSRFADAIGRPVPCRHCDSMQMIRRSNVLAPAMARQKTGPGLGLCARERTARGGSPKCRQPRSIKFRMDRKASGPCGTSQKII